MPEIGVNKVILIGRAGADTEVKYTAGGKAFANFSLAVNETFRKGDGEQRDKRPVGEVRGVGKASRDLRSVPDQGNARLRRRQAANAQIRRPRRKRTNRDGNRSLTVAVAWRVQERQRRLGTSHATGARHSSG